MRTRMTAALTAALTLAMLGGAATAWATDPITLDSGYITDDAGAIEAGQIAAAEDRLAQLSTDTGIDVYVAIVDEFTNPSSSEDWANAVASDNGLGVSQYLFAIAMDSRQFYISADSSGPIDFEQIADIESAVTPALRADDIAGAIDDAADAFETAASGGTVSDGTGSNTGTSQADTGSSPVFVVILIVVILAIAALLIAIVLRSRRKRAASGGKPEQLDPKELARRAASALVETDDALRTSEQELGFARAQFGDEATAPFVATLAAAKEGLDRAFTLKQQLDDEIPDTAETVRSWNSEIIALCTAAQAELDAKVSAFDDLRKLEQNAAPALAGAREGSAQAAAALEGAQTKLTELSVLYAPAALATVADNVSQARERLSFADAELDAAHMALNKGESASAALHIRAAESAVGQANQLEEAIGTLGADLAAAQSRVPALVAELEQDIATAEAVTDADGRIAGAIAGARHGLETARTTTPPRPILTLQLLENANEQLDAVLNDIRDKAERVERAERHTDQVLMQAGAQISAARDYITARRGAVGATARTRLSEAASALAQAQSVRAQDPEQALPLAQRSYQLATQAIELAQNDVGGFGGQGGGSNALFGAMLGGIVVNSMLGGGRRGGFGGGGFGGRGRRGGGRF
ncbi:putative membrane protein YgcG [Microbacterium endophyticum]|uniref:Putative membrane protein YgcG n=1 Tax=Microbacterium endophyticum TaxID=1526412 RepID=A0A7W4V3L6_9MICO|nr:TPM domain-containing protein [Microbacterium endophyticum]MBB2976261.1 putative membrane protein YgcG [Microbacterium endophyticum]NIK35141.1 putative membrane protein YgcG [Microbacterium endophyticum]